MFETTFYQRLAEHNERVNQKAETILTEVKANGGDVAKLRMLMIKRLNFGGRLSDFEKLVARAVIKLTKE